jgi:uncharacterized protein
MGIQKALFPAVLAVFMTACTTAPEAVAQTSETARTITVNGEGRASAVPDMAVISIGVQTDGDTAAGALRENSAAMKATIDKLKELGVANKDIQTSGLSVNPRYDYKQDRSNPRIIGYVASNTVTVRLRNLDDAGAVIDQTVQSGANSLGGISFVFADPKPLYAAARKDAVKDAKAKAELLTEAAGVDLGRLMTIQDGYARSPSPRPMQARMAMEADASVPLAAGESSVTASITLIYEIK